MLMGKVLDRITAPSDAVIKAREAYVALWTDPEVLASDEETDRYIALNSRVNAARSELSPVDRCRAFRGALEQRDAAERLAGNA